jgi:hypothetical protein
MGSVQLYRGGDSERDQRTRQWRKERIERFTRRQWYARKWISFNEIADWRSQEDQSNLPTTKKRTQAFEWLAHDLLTGEFDKGGRTRVLYLHPDGVIRRMTAKWLRNVINYNYDLQYGMSEYLPHCWIPRQSFDRWCEKRRLQGSLAYFQPRKSPRVFNLRSTSGQESSAIKALSKHLDQNRQLKRAEASSWCDSQGFKLTIRAFSRVWPKARKNAGLPAKGRVGRPRKSSR